MAEQFIAGEFTDSEGERRTVASPTGGEAIDTVPDATASEVRTAVDAAAAAFPAWRATRASRRGELL
ncbi:MAG: aldehyde dehydrogenase family protein, partial [Solirubrobacteraceae bacterium]